MILYFGAWSPSKVGHFLYTSDGMSSRRYEARLPFRETILDAGLLDNSQQQEEGKARLVVIGGFTVVTFWDRSADSRIGSNSAFIVDSVMTFEEVMAIAAREFPGIMVRIPKVWLE